jgi:TldD protein
MLAAATARAISEGPSSPGAVAVRGSGAPPRNLYPVEIAPTDLPVAAKTAVLNEIDAHARRADPRIVQVMASVVAEHRNVLIAASDATLVADVQPLVRINVQVIAEDKEGRREIGYQGAGGRFDLARLLAPEGWKPIADEAVRLALVNLEAKPCPAGTMDVVLGPGWPGILLHEAIGHGLEGDFNRKKTSAFSGRIGERVAAGDVTVVDDGTLPERRGSLNVDDEGTATQRTVLIENGILRGYMQDRLNARLMGGSSTGNGRRESYAHLPMPRMTNTFMLAGQDEPEEIIRSVDRGLYAVTFGGGQVDITSGKFVFSASEAYRIEGGEITTPVRSATLIGNGPDVLLRVSRIGHDLALDRGVGSCGKDGQSVPVGDDRGRHGGMSGDFLETLRRVLARAGRAGAHAADAVLVESDSVETRVRGEEIDFVKQARERILGIRAFVKGPAGLRSAITSTSDLASEALDRLADDTVALATATAEDPDAGLPEERFATELPDLALLDPSDREVALEEQIDQARRAERSARSIDPRITHSEGSETTSSFSRVTFGNTAGFLAEYESAAHSLSSMPIASENGAMQTDHWLSVARQRSALEAPEAVGRRAAERALARLGARRVPTCEVPVIFDGVTARSLLGNLASCLSGYAIYRSSSFLAGRLEEMIASELVSVVDDGRLPGGLGSRPFDGEGLPTRRKTVIERGRLETYLLDSYSRRKRGMSRTGKAARSAASAPRVSATNLWMEPGTSSLDEMIAGTERGLLVTDLFGFGFNAVTGDFSRGATGAWIEKGEAIHPVEEITVAGNLGEMLTRIDAVGSELIWLGSVAAPALRVARMTVAGE